MDRLLKHKFIIRIGYVILASHILHLAKCECLSFRAVPSKFHRPSKAIEKYEDNEWIKDDYPVINNWPTFSMYDNDTCRKPKIRIHCQYVLKRYLVYLKNNRRPKNTYERVLFNNEGWALVTQVYDTRFIYYNNSTKLDRLYILKRYLVYLKNNRRPKNTYERVLFNNEGWALVTQVYDTCFIYYNNSTKLDRLYLYDAMKLQTDLPSYLDFLCSNWKDEPGKTTLLVAGTANYLKNSITLITVVYRIYVTLCKQ